jgi:hypothetical protein
MNPRTSARRAASRTMKRHLFVVLMLTIASGACTDDQAPIPTPPSPNPTASPDGQVSAEIQIYSAVIRRLVTKDHTFGGGPSPFKHVYVINGPIRDAGDPMAGTLFGPARRQFPSEVVTGVQQRLRNLVPVEFVTDGDSVRRGKQRVGGVKNDGVIISLGPIEEREDGRVHVSNGLWCGGTCGQWLTYVLREQRGQWKITGTTGPYAIS